MRSRDRVMTTLGLEEPDRVPLCEIAVNEPIVEKVTGLSSPQTRYEEERELNERGGRESQARRLSRIEREVDRLVACYRHFGFDAIPAGPTLPVERPAVKLLDDCTWIDEWGVKYRQRPSDPLAWYVSGTLSVEDIAAFTPPDPYAEGRMDSVTAMVRRVKGEMAVFGAGLTLSASYLARGIVGLTLDFYRTPHVAKRWIEKIADYHIELGKQIVDCGVDALVVSGDDAEKGGPIFSPRIYREFYYPQYKRMVDAFHARGMMVVKHTDGNTYRILDDMVRAGFNGYHAIEPIAGMDIGVVKEKYGDRLCLLGNIDCSHTLSLSSLSQVAEETRSCIRKAAPGGGHILGSSNALHPAVNLDNVYEMVRTARTFGRY
ncbi:MAG: uroporphyrinogen decarboxylase family protein [Candidatus Bathyarchaeia archaeon]